MRLGICFLFVKNTAYCSELAKLVLSPEISLRKWSNGQYLFSIPAMKRLNACACLDGCLEHLVYLSIGISDSSSREAIA
jgi:hypothetical protein